MKTIGVITVLLATAVAGCAQRPEEIGASYVSPVSYERYSCNQLSEEARRVASRVAEVTGVQDTNAQSDAVATGVALVLFWPAAFFISGDDENAAQLARLKGELEALEQASIAKNCGIEFRRASGAS